MKCPFGFATISPSLYIERPTRWTDSSRQETPAAPKCIIPETTRRDVWLPPAVLLLLVPAQVVGHGRATRTRTPFYGHSIVGAALFHEHGLQWQLQGLEVQIQIARAATGTAQWSDKTYWGERRRYSRARLYYSRFCQKTVTRLPFYSLLLSFVNAMSIANPREGLTPIFDHGRHKRALRYYFVPRETRKAVWPAKRVKIEIFGLRWKHARTRTFVRSFARSPLLPFFQLPAIRQLLFLAVLPGNGLLQRLAG